jgi:hypothetical protein
MRKSFFIFATLVGVLAGSAAMAQSATPFSCNYNEYTGTPTLLFQRVQVDSTDWYGPYNTVEFCNRTDGAGSYVIIAEELVKGMRVYNIPRTVLSSSTDSSGSIYNITDDIDHVVLKVSPDGTSLNVAAIRFGTDKYDVALKLTWHK